MKKIPAWLVLFVITLAAGLLLSYTNSVTAPAIADQSAKAAEASRSTVLAEAVAFEQLDIAEDAIVDWCYAGKNAEGEICGYVAQITVGGFGGEIEVIVGQNMENVLTGISVGGSNFSETAGLGAKTREASFTEQYAGKTAPLTVIKAGQTAEANTIDAVTSATISSTAVTNGVNAAAEFISQYTVVTEE